MKLSQPFLLLVVIFLITQASFGNAGPVEPSSSKGSSRMKETHPKYEVIEPVKGHPGFYTAPTARVIDLRGFKPGAEFRHPHTGVIYVLPTDPNASIYPSRE